MSDPPTSRCIYVNNTWTKPGFSKVESLPTAEKLKHKNTQWPKICGWTVAFAQNDFRCNVAQCAAERPRLLAHLNLLQTSGANLRYTSTRSASPPVKLRRQNVEPKSVCGYQFSVTLLIEDNVFRPDVSIDDPLRVKKTQRFDDTSCVELGAAVI